ncbi:MAG: hypothetical protein EBS30_14685, partial [Planctomycetes bacterium]|nr:hypothetical protein [Planctomycetota bacterium]
LQETATILHGVKTPLDKKGIPTDMPPIQDSGAGIKDPNSQSIRLLFPYNVLPNLLVFYSLKDSGTLHFTTRILNLSIFSGKLGNFQKTFSFQLPLSNPCMQPVAWYYRPSFLA